MTILPPPPKPEPRHTCGASETGVPSIMTHQAGTLWECPECGRWWKLHTSGMFYEPGWTPVSWYDVPARRRIAAHETEKMHYRAPSTVGTRHWWDCHPNPRKGRP